MRNKGLTYSHLARLAEMDSSIDLASTETVEAVEHLLTVMSQIPVRSFLGSTVGWFITDFGE